MKRFLILLLFIATETRAQDDHIGQFVKWKTKDGQAENFKNGYQQHLGWHASNHDTWNWYGWYTISGPNDGLFVDATFGHNWADFDNPVNPTGDRADNVLHVYPFADVQAVFKVKFYPSLSTADISSLNAKLLRIVTLKVSNTEDGKKVIGKLKSSISSGKELPFLLFKVVDGEALNQLILILPSENFKAFGQHDDLEERLATIESALKLEVIQSVCSETLRFNADLSRLIR